MGINNIRLSPSLLAALYPDSLVMVKNQDKRIEAAAGYRFLGNNLRKISILVHYPGLVFLPDAQLEFLGKILSPCHLTIADVALLNNAVNPIKMQELQKHLKPQTVFICGINPASLGISDQLEPFTITVQHGVSTLLLPALTDINRETPEGKQYKKQLWACLQKLFKL